MAMERPGSCSVTGALLLFSALLPVAGGQYEKYSVRSFPESELMPLDSAYRYSLEQYTAGNWRESIRYLELSLRVNRLLRDSQLHCHSDCSRAEPEDRQLPRAEPEDRQLPRAEPEDRQLPRAEPEDRQHLRELRQFSRILHRAVCIKSCKLSLPVFKLTSPHTETLHLFERRIPYKYLENAYFQINNLEKSIAAAHTFLQKNPKDAAMQKKMAYYKTIPDIETYLVDVEAREHETLFLKAVKAYNIGNFRNSITEMEHALPEYYKVYEECISGCEASCDVTGFKDFYLAVADHYVETLKCKVKCEQILTPNVGGFFVEKFVATMYHYLQFAYYKLNDIKNAVSCVATYMLFDPQDEIMQQNLVYYRFYREQWSLQEGDFQPRTDAHLYYNQTRLQIQLLEFADNFLQSDDEMEVLDETFSHSEAEITDEEFEGDGDYEETILADWWQEPREKGDLDDAPN
ncbi:cartilage-associated protein-like isoform X3 [Scyliorhinus canicula]|uniref:cartilage-associated protein-like isoform X3 n=1 Tax=Scyliorhinus canicula TaxID=7830 RepID=UPI0018F46A52|nr:cartilage-associated protein-like isoform X3 [Scyliorhinus canicula]